jgi:FkbM family methyltransferase
VQVDVAPIDEVVQEYGLGRIDLIKLDVEGAEHEALEGADVGDCQSPLEGV